MDARPEIPCYGLQQVWKLLSSWCSCFACFSTQRRTTLLEKRTGGRDRDFLRVCFAEGLLTIHHLPLLVEPTLGLIFALQYDMIALQPARQVVPRRRDHGVLALEILDDLLMCGLMCSFGQCPGTSEQGRHMKEKRRDTCFSSQETRFLPEQTILILQFKRTGKTDKTKLTFCAANAEPDSKALIFFWRS